MALDQATFETEIGNVKTSLDSGDYSGARQWAAKALLTWQNLPASYQISGRGRALHQNADNVEKAIDLHQRASMGTGNVALVSIQFGRAR